MLPALLIVAAAFVALFVVRVGGAQRQNLMQRWPTLVLAVAAFFAALRCAIWPTIALAALAVLAWTWLPAIASRMRRPAPGKTEDDPEDAAARAVLGVSADASASNIRAAYRLKMAQAHPDRGGSHAAATRLTAARDRLLKKLR